MKKLLLTILISVLAISCTPWQDILLPDSCNVRITGGNDMGLISYVRVENIEYRGNRTSETYYSKYGDGIEARASFHDVDRSKVDTMIVYAYPSEAHDVKIFVEEVEKKISNGHVTLDFRPWNIDIVFSLKEPYIKEPTQNANTYEIRIPEELRWVSSQSYKGNTFQNKTIKLMNDIDMLNNDFTGIAANDTNFKFSGTFDGNNHKVHNFNIKIDFAYIGFIGILSSSGVVKNLTVSGLISSPYLHIGGIVGENHGTIENCINNASVEGYRYTGGIAGLNYGSIEGSINNALITGGEKYTGGIAGANRGSIKNVKNTGTIKAKKDSGRGQIIGGSVEGSVVENATESGSVIEL